MQQFCRIAASFFASKILKVDTMFVLSVLLFYGLLSRVSPAKALFASPQQLDVGHPAR